MSENQLTLEGLRKQFQFNKKLRKYSDRHYPNDHIIYGKVVSNIDVEGHRNYLINSLATYRNISPLVQDDIKDIEQAMGRYEIAVRKVISNFDNPNTNFNYSPEELSYLIKDLSDQQENVHKLLMRKLFQD